MLKIAAIVDKRGTAIDRLANGVAPYLPLEYKVIDLHPKRPDPDQMDNLRWAVDADLIDWQYFKSAETAKELLPELRDKPGILTHYNPYSLDGDWSAYDRVVADNKTIEANLKRTTENVSHINLAVDHTFWKYKVDKEFNNRVLMVANRIEGKKGIREVAEACEKIEAQFVLAGSISDGDYMHQVLQTTNVEFHEKISNEELRELYYGASLHVCNSQDNFESGTLPILESMFCGTPVLSRKVGHVPELNNVVIHDGAVEDVDKLSKNIKELLNDTDKLNEIRDKAWNSVKGWNNERRAYQYLRLFREVLYQSPSVSVIMPIYDKPEITRENLEALEESDYDNLEIIICNDNPNPETNVFNKEIVEDFMTFSKRMVRYIDEPTRGYGLAKQRNLGASYASGDILVFCDQRIKVEKDCIKNLTSKVGPYVWTYGNKGVHKEFVENISAVKREDFIKFGMFNERITQYGGMSQETRSRFRLQGGKTEFVKEARAQQIGKSSNRNRKRDEIIKSKNLLWRLGLH